jgi:hypothetical protein
VGPVIVQYEVHFQGWRDGAVNGVQEFAEFYRDTRGKKEMNDGAIRECIPGENNPP